ncbi:unnamed protein product, partial [Thlaspi arvense]
MPFPMKIQPLDSQAYGESIRNDSAKPVLKSRLKRLFDLQFPSVLRISSAEKLPAGEPQYGKDGVAEFEPSSVCLDKMVQNFIEETNEKQSAVKCSRNRCNCFNGNNNDSSDDEFETNGGFGDSIPTASFGDYLDTLKSLIPCASVAERNLLADISKIVEKNKTSKRKDDLRKIVTDGLLLVGYDASICKSRWEKSASYPAGEYEYIDVNVEGDRVLVDVDFRSEFEIARSTGGYKSILQSLPHIFVGRADRLQQIVSITELEEERDAHTSVEEGGVHASQMAFPYARTTAPAENDADKETDSPAEEVQTEAENKSICPPKTDAVKDSDASPKHNPSESVSGELELIFGEEQALSEEEMNSGEADSRPPAKTSGDKEKPPPSPAVASPWQPPTIKPRSCERGAKVVTGLASLLREKP